MWRWMGSLWLKFLKPMQDLFILMLRGTVKGSLRWPPVFGNELQTAVDEKRNELRRSETRYAVKTRTELRSVGEDILPHYDPPSVEEWIDPRIKNYLTFAKLDGFKDAALGLMGNPKATLQDLFGEGSITFTSNRGWSLKQLEDIYSPDEFVLRIDEVQGDYLRGLRSLLGMVWRLWETVIISMRDDPDAARVQRAIQGFEALLKGEGYTTYVIKSVEIKHEISRSRRRGNFRAELHDRRTSSKRITV